MNNDFSRGSEWRKWDLHLHTPSSYDYQNSSVTNEDIVNKLIDNNIALAVITDHHYIDVERFFELKNIAQENVVFLPGIELRTELGGSESVHITTVFPDFKEKSELKDLWNKLNVKLELMDQIKEKGNDCVYVNFENASKIIKELDGFISIHAGNKSNSLENITNALSYKMAIKTNIANIVDFYEIGTEKDITDYKLKVFPSIGRIIPLVRGSDNHNILDYQLKFNCWIKADATYAGLKQAIVECNERIYIGDIPEKLSQIESNKTKYIDKIEIGSSEPSEHWFNQIIHLNPELVSIIGNKGNGKSALADILGSLGNSKNFNSFSFLSDNKFFKSTSADKHYAKLCWICDDDYTKEIHLKKDEIYNGAEIEKVKYIPQSYFEKVCNLVDDQKEFKKEIEKVIFRHLKDEDKLGADDFDSLVKLKKDAAYKDIENCASKLKNAIYDYVTVSNKLLIENLQLNKSSFDELSRQQQSLEANILALEKNKIEKPTDNANSAKIKDIEDKINKSNEELEKLKKQSELLAKQNNKLNKVKEEIQSIQAYYHDTSSELFEDLKDLSIKFEDIITLNYDETILYNKEQELQQSSTNTDEQIDKFIKEISALKLIKENEEKQLSGEEKKYQDYINSKTKYKQELKQILGSEEDPLSINDTYYYYKYLCSDEYIKSSNEKKELLFKEIEQLSINIFEAYLEVRKIYEKLKENVDTFIKDFEFNPNSNIKIEFRPKIKILKEPFVDNLLLYLEKSGSFRGEERDKFFEYLCNLELESKDDFTQMTSTLLKTIKENSGNNEDTVNKSLKKDVKAEDLYSYIFSGSYLDVDYELEFNDKPISMLSPGERGLLLLTFFLLADTSNVPLILDQPEENLDNQTIYNILVQLIKNAKKKRQVIVVTHNPNLAVVCDSEQIICADFDISRIPKIKYLTGSIENEDINKKIVDILEGTMPAFKNREDKYFYNNSN